MKYLGKAIVVFSLFLTIAGAHVSLLKPSGGEMFAVGDSMHIQWKQEINHGTGTWEIYFSKNGLSWGEPIYTAAINPSDDKLNFYWHIPDSVTTSSSMIRVVQNNDLASNYSSESGSFIIGPLTGLNKDDNLLREVFTLNAVYPNPFNGTAKISFELFKQSFVEIDIYNLIGCKVEKLYYGNLNPGNHNIKWNPKNLPSGIYFCTVGNGVNIQSRRIVYIK